MHHEVGFQDIPPENLPTLHDVYQKQAAEGWKKIPMNMLHAVIESEALPVEYVKHSLMPLLTVRTGIIFLRAML